MKIESLKTRFIAQNRVLEARDANKKYTFVTVPTNYIVRKMKLVSHFRRGITTTSFPRPGNRWWRNHCNIFPISWELLVEEPLQLLSQGTIMEEPSERTLLNVHIIKDKS